MALPIINQYLTLNGDGTGTRNANGNYSVTPDIFYIQPPTGHKYEIARMLVFIRDTGNFSADGYGANGVLTNGVSVKLVNDSGVITDYMNGHPLKSNAEWGQVCYDVQYISFGAGDNFVCVRWTFAKSGAPISLDGRNNERLEIELSDDFTGIVEQTFMVQGVRTS